MPYMQMTEEQFKVPVLKNVIYALRLVWQTDKRLPIGYLLQEGLYAVFSRYLQNILFLKILLDVITGSGDFRTYVGELAAFALLALVVKVAQWEGMRMEKCATKRVLKLLNDRIFEKALSVDVACYENPEFYDKYQRATMVTTNSFFDLICFDFSAFVADVVALVCVMATVAAVHPLYLLFLVPVFFVFAVEVYKSKCVYRRDMSMTANKRMQAYVQRTVYLREYAKDMRTSNIFAVMVRRMEAATKANVRILRDYGVRLFLYSVVSSLLGELLPVLGTYAFACYSFVQGSGLTVSGFSVVASGINAVRESTLDTTECFDEMTLMALYFQNLREFLDYQPQVVSGPLPVPPLETLEFCHVDFTYPGTDRRVLHDVNFTLRQGETLAVVGINGAGKSTLVKLLLRFYDPTVGQILYNGKPLPEYDLEQLRAAFGTVFQDYKNFALSVNENVIGHACTPAEKALAEQALRHSGVWDKIASLPRGADTVLTREFDEAGTGLSGGENQKVSTARLFARDFQIAVLDEPSSALDPVAEYKMYENLLQVTENKTVIFISHRLSSAVLSDRILVLADGQVQESGSHRQLMEQNGLYADMFRLQASGYKQKGGAAGAQA